jgi:RNA polymerase sigma-70 factor, ECF subfamily
MTTSTRQFDDILDDTLAQRARRGSGAAFAALVARHVESVYALAANMCATSQDVEEVLQQAFLAAWRQLQFLPAGARFTTWLHRIAMTTALARRRGGTSSLGLGPVFDGSPTLTELLRAALERLDDRVRAAFVLRDLLDLPVDEVAAVMEVTPAAVRRDAHRARLMLRDFIDQREAGLNSSWGRTSSAGR